MNLGCGNRGRTFGAQAPSGHRTYAESLAFFAICPDHPVTMRESPYIRSIPRQLPWVIGLAVVMAVIGPFGSYDYMGLPTRLIYFVVIGELFSLQILGIAALLSLIDAIESWSITVRTGLAGFLAAVPGTAEILLVHGWLVRPIPLRYAPQIFLEAAFLSVVISAAVGLMVERRLHTAADVERARTAAVPKSIEPQAAPDFFRRIPPVLGRDLLALEMEDHYLRIHTALGSDLILLRLRDALAELGPQRGLQVHRSWWVANGAVASTERNGGRNVLVLRNGLNVPVSKSFHAGVKEAGWLA